MKRKTITVDEVMALNPCEGYDRDRVEALFDGRKRVKVPDIVGADIPVRDRIWLLTQDHFFTDRELRLYARWCAWRVRDLWTMPNVVRRYLLTGEGRNAAEYAAANAAAVSAANANADTAAAAARFAAANANAAAVPAANANADTAAAAARFAAANANAAAVSAANANADTAAAAARFAAAYAAAYAAAAAARNAAVDADANAAGSAARFAESHRQLGALKLLAGGRLTVETDLKGNRYMKTASDQDEGRE